MPDMEEVLHGWLRLPPYGKRCAFCGMSRNAIVNLIIEGKVRGKKLGAATLVDKASLAAYIESLPDMPIKTKARRNAQLSPNHHNEPITPHGS